MEKPAKEPLDASSVDLSKLMSWYISHCDGEWEHHHRISLETLDNPGWILKVNLVGSDLEGVTMPVLSEDDEDAENSPWIDCRIENQRFVGASDPAQLPRLISVFASLLDGRTASAKKHEAQTGNRDPPQRPC